MLIFDIESNGLLDEINRLHCVVIHDTETGERVRYNHKKGNIVDGLERLQNADSICGHNIIGYDVPAIQIVYPWFKPKGEVVDTLVVSRFTYPDIKDRDFRRFRSLSAKGKEWIPMKLFGRHSLEAWGHRLGEHKGDYDGGWERWSPEMEDYCEQDVHVTLKIWNKLSPLIPRGDVFELEHKVQYIIQRQVRHGFKFDVPAAARLYSQLSARRQEIKDKLSDIFGHWYQYDKPFTPKRSNRSAGYTEGVSLSKVKLVYFNPASRAHIANRLTKLYGWKPIEKTETGEPKVDETVLAGLKYPNVDLLVEYLMLDKRIGQLAEGKQAWLKVEQDGWIHGSVNSNGAVTGRMTHSQPNVAQVPSGKSLFGSECRALFLVPDGYKLVGCDAEGIELRALAHFMYRYDKGKYAEAVVKGDKTKGTDAHTINMNAIGLKTRDAAKTWFYAFIYGSGVVNLGAIFLQDVNINKSAFLVGRTSRSNFETRLPALGSLIKKVKETAKERGFLVGLDGRHLPIRALHAALNTLLQSAGAVIMKRALVILDANLQVNGLIPGEDYEFVANVHDEFQIQVKEECHQLVMKLSEDSIKDAGEYYKFKCELAGSAEAGSSWAETH